MANGQDAGIHYYPQSVFDEAKTLYQKGILAESIELFRIASTQLNDHPYDEGYLLVEEARLYLALASMNLELDSGEGLINNFIKDFYPSESCIDAIMAQGSYYYNQRNYRDAITAYSKIDIYPLDEIQHSEVSFKRGYCAFVLRDFNLAMNYLNDTRDIRNIYFYPSNYYYGMIQYFLEDYDGAIASFERVSSSQKYKTQIPYYISQIYFAQGQTHKLVDYAERKIKEGNLAKEKEIRLLLGQVYFERDDYKRALPHLIFHEEQSEKLTKEQFYQLAFVQYKVGEYKGAIENFRELALLDSRMGQISAYYLANCYIKTDEKRSAHTAFKKVSQMDFDKGMQEEAKFNYGKLSAELGKERVAINTLVSFGENSKYYRDAQILLSDIFISTNDYANATKVLEKINSKTKGLQETYQKVTFYRGLQLYKDDEKEMALDAFNSSLALPVIPSVEAQAKFWQAQVYHDKGDFAESRDRYDEYFVVARDLTLPSNADHAIANYNQAYNYMKTGDFEAAVLHFNTSRKLISDRSHKTSLDVSITNDALLRAGDCLFVSGNHGESIFYYDKAIESNATEADYALYQKAIGDGLINQPFAKIISLEKIVMKYPNSEYRDDAMHAMGVTYLSLGNNDEAFTTFLNLTNQYGSASPFYNDSYLKMGLISYNQGDTDKAIEYYKEIFKYNPSSKESNEAVIALEEIFIQDLGKSDEYFSLLSSLPGFELSGYSKDSLSYKIGEIQFEEGECHKAISSFTNYLKKYKQGYFQLEALYKRGECYTSTNDYDEALKDYESLVSRGHSEYYENSLRKAALISYNHAQDFSKSLTHYKALEEFTTSEDYKYEAQKGALHSAFREEISDDILLYAGMVFNNPQSTDADRLRAKYYEGKIFLRRSLKDKALQSFTYLRDDMSNQAAESAFHMANIYYGLDDMEKAESECNYVTKMYRGYPQWVAKSLILLSDIYVKKNDTFNARAALEAVIENFNSDEKILSQAKAKLAALRTIEDTESRIAIPDTTGIMELDTIGNE